MFDFARDAKSHRNTASTTRSLPIPVGGKWKRSLDILVATISLVILSPLLLVVSALILVMMGRPVFYSHVRVGFAGKRFHCYKFRTMVANSEAVLRRHLEASPEAAKEWQLSQKLRNDPRITSLGKLLRKSSVDELPQLINVLKGDMSCVGPRPIIVDELRRYGSEAAQYLKARPGISGAWQVCGRSSCSYEERVSLDSSYVKDWSVSRDIWILIQTIPAVFRFDRTS